MSNFESSDLGGYSEKLPPHPQESQESDEPNEAIDLSFADVDADLNDWPDCSASYYLRPLGDDPTSAMSRCYPDYEDDATTGSKIPSRTEVKSLEDILAAFAAKREELVAEGPEAIFREWPAPEVLDEASEPGEKSEIIVPPERLEVVGEAASIRPPFLSFRQKFDSARPQIPPAETEVVARSFRTLMQTFSEMELCDTSATVDGRDVSVEVSDRPDGYIYISQRASEGGQLYTIDEAARYYIADDGVVKRMDTTSPSLAKQRGWDVPYDAPEDQVLEATIRAEAGYGAQVLADETSRVLGYNDRPITKQEMDGLLDMANANIFGPILAREAEEKAVEQERIGPPKQKDINDLRTLAAAVYDDRAISEVRTAGGKAGDGLHFSLDRPDTGPDIDPREGHKILHAKIYLDLVHRGFGEGHRGFGDLFVLRQAGDDGMSTKERVVILMADGVAWDGIVRDLNAGQLRILNDEIRRGIGR